MEKEKNRKCDQETRKKGDVRSNSSPVCYADSPEVRPEYRPKTEKVQPTSKDDEPEK